MRRARSSGIAPAVLSALLLAAVGLGAAPASAARKAQEPPFTITADSVEYDSVSSVYTARGNVRIHKGDETLTADWVMFSNVTREGLASGHVVHQDGPDRLTGEFLQFNIDTLKGFIREGVLTSDTTQYLTRADEVRKTGADTYDFKKVRFTTCQCPDGGDPSWELKADTASLDTEGYAVAKNTTFEMFGIPILWSPWAAYPVRRERSTGFLFPEFNNTNRSGFDVGVPFFWAARHDLNVTLTPQYLQKRGVKGALDLEWVRPHGTQGNLFFTIINDEDIKPDDPQHPIEKLRWAIDSQQVWELPGDVTARIDANLIRDNLFLRDFRDMRQFLSDRFMESVGFAEHHFFDAGWLQWTTATRWADDLQNPDNLDRDRELLQRMPDTSVRVLPKRLVRLGPVSLVASLDADHTYFWSRRKGSDQYPGLVVGNDLFVDTGVDGVPSFREPDSSGNVTSPDQHGDDFGPGNPSGTEGDGIFEEGELLADRGQRVDLHPKVAMPFRVKDMVEVVPEVGYHATIYDTEAQGFADRGLVTGRLDLRTRLRRSWAPAFISRPVTHIVEPFLSWAYVQKVGQSGNPLFVPATALPQTRIRGLDLDNVTDDTADRIPEFNGFTVGVRNELIGRSLLSLEDPETGEVSYTSDQSRLVADVTFAYSYDISDSRLGNLLIEGSWWPWADWTTRFQLNYDPDHVTPREGLLDFGYWSEHGSNLGVTYRFVDPIPDFFEQFRTDRSRLNDYLQGFNRVNQISVNGRFAFTRQWAVTYSAGWAFEQSLFLRNQGGIEYTSKCLCWAARIEADYRRQSGFDFGFRYTLLGLGDDPVRPFSRAGRLSIRR